ncbi:protein ACCELERATED CELL DEATH 6 [Prunus persica]|uniref:protein ACCELERATED CELL DEATH 6 n=1 Tax=Prunus persica TaxID=3760 RepID=UPI0009AB53F5|nr:protein ACCELERATED CELL DEATH 6 [Prunus persica]
MDHSTDQTASSTPLASANTVLIRGMDLDVFNAAKEGKTDVLKRRHHLDQILTPTKNTILHIYISFASTPNYVEPEEEALRPPSVVNEILQMCPALLSQKNESGETALHIAARHGRADIVELLIKTAKAGPREDLENGPSSSVEAWQIFIRRYTLHPTYQGPIGRTALHAAVIHGDEEMTTEILNKEKDLAIVADEKGAYLGDEANKKTALQIAASKGHVNVMEQLISHCPDCCKVVDRRRRNAFHYALEKHKPRIIEFVLKGTWLSNVLLNAKDVDGNTPLHLLNAPLNPWIPFIDDARVDKMAFNKENMNALDVIKANDDLQDMIFVANDLKRNGASSGHRILSENDNDGQKLKENKGGEDTETNKNIRDSHLIVAALVATVTFAAGVTMPGGYYQASDQGNGPSNGPTPGYARENNSIFLHKLTRLFVIMFKK